MVSFQYDGTMGGLLADLAVGIDAFTVMQTANGPIVFAASGVEGGLICIGFDGVGAPQIIDQVYYEPSTVPHIDNRLELLETPNGTVLLFGSSGPDDLLGIDVTALGFGTATVISAQDIAGPADTLTAQTANGFVYSVANNGDLRCYQENSSGDLVESQLIQDEEATFFATPTALSAAEVGTTSFLLTACAQDTGISAFRVDGATGSLTQTATMSAEAGLGMYEIPIGIETTTLAGRTYVVVAATSDGGSGASLSVMELTDAGALLVTDHIIDNLETRFGNVSGMSVVSHNGWSYVTVAGGDGGLSVFAIMPGGQLTHIETLTSTLGADLGSLTGLSTSVTNNVMTIITAQHDTNGLISLSADLSEQGLVAEAASTGGGLSGSLNRDMLVGGVGADTISGDDADDILRDGHGIDSLLGGAGADRFILDWDGERDVIGDFEAGDILDLSFTPMLYSFDQITVTSYAWGALLEYRGEELEVRSALGQSLSASDISTAIDWSIDRPPLIIRVDQSGTNGADTLEGGNANDILRGLRGDDVIYGFEGDDFIDGGKFNDTVYAGSGNDTVEGGHDRDLIYLDAGDDVFLNSGRIGEEHSDTIWAGTGQDSVSTAGGFDLIYGEAGDDTLVSQAGNDTVQGGSGNDSIHAGEGADLIDAGDDDDIVFGGADSDTIFGGTGQDTVDGGAGDDLVFLNLGNDLYESTEFGNDSVYAGWGNDTILGGSGADLLDGQGGLDLINAGEGADLVYGGLQEDTLIGDAGNDTIYGDDGSDLAFLGLGNDVFWDNADGTGRDTVFGGWGNDTITGDGGHDSLNGDGGNDLIDGGVGNDALSGGLGNDTLFGGEGHDTVNGGDGRDLVYLNIGHDLFIDVSQSGGEGRDSVYGGWGRDTIQGGGGNDVFHGQGDADLIDGGSGNDLIYGGDHNDTLSGGVGNDTIVGGNGQDRVSLNQGNDQFLDNDETGALGRDIVYAGWGNDTIFGGGGDDLFFGNWGNDVISGGIGNDRIEGGQDDDTLSGGDGADSFVFISDIGADEITDFVSGIDRLQLSASLVGNRTAEEVISTFASVQGNDVFFNFSDGQSITLTGVTTTTSLSDDIDFL